MPESKMHQTSWGSRSKVATTNDDRIYEEVMNDLRVIITVMTQEGKQPVQMADRILSHILSRGGEIR